MPLDSCVELIGHRAYRSCVRRAIPTNHSLAKVPPLVIPDRSSSGRDQERPELLAVRHMAVGSAALKGVKHGEDVV